MNAYTICRILLSFILLRGAFCQPVPQQRLEQKTEAEAIASEKENALINEYSAKFANLIHEVLQDEALVNNHDSELKSIKQSLSYVYITHDVATDVASKAKVIQYFLCLYKNYKNTPEKELSNPTVVMLEALQRYGFFQLTEEVKQAFGESKLNKCFNEKN